MTALVLGIDPGATSGWALVTVAPNPVLATFGKTRLDKGEVPTRAMTVMSEMGPEHIGLPRSSYVAAMVIESQFVALNIKTAIRLAQYAGRWEEACLATFPDIPVQWVKPNEWQTAMLAGAMGGGRAKRAQRKAAAISVCLARWKVKLETDVADAALIAAFVAERMAFEKRIDKTQKRKGIQ